MTLFKKCLRLSQIHDLCISRWKNLIFSEGQPRKIEFLIFLPSSILLEVMKKKLATSSFPKYSYANLPTLCQMCNMIKTLCRASLFSPREAQDTKKVAFQTTCNQGASFNLGQRDETLMTNTGFIRGSFVSS